MTDGLSASEYRELLMEALEDAVESDTSPPTAHTLFMPDSHRRALYVDNTVVQGGRGVGKTFWYRSLLQPELREFAADEYRIVRLRKLRVSPGYGLDFAYDKYPGPGVLAALLAAGTPAYDIWYAVLLNALRVPQVCALADWKDKADWVGVNPSAVQLAVEEADRRAHGEDLVELLLFDGVEHLNADRERADQLLAGIMQLALQMRFGTRNIRLKVFIRPDLFRGAGHRFPDASKLLGNAARLDWTRTDLYGLLYHYLGNQESDLSERFRAVTGGWVASPDGRRQVPPLLLRNDEGYQAEQFNQIGGATFDRSKLYTWLPNHLMDGHGLVSPRSFLRAVFRAAEVTHQSHFSHTYALHRKGLIQGVQAASEVRVAQVKEDTPWVATAIGPLQGSQVPVARETLISLWRTQGLSGRLYEAATASGQAAQAAQVHAGPRDPEDLQGVVEQLKELGVLRERNDGRLDLPDVYRVAFGVGRAGGVPTLGQ